MPSILSLALLLGLLASCWIFAWIGLRFTGEESSGAAAGHMVPLDGLRGILALSVFAHHAVCTRSLYLRGEWSPGDNIVYAQAGSAAVTLFFFITGFLFWSKLRRQPRLDLGQHLRSRLARLGPAYWASIVVLLAIVAVRTGFKWQAPVGRVLGNVGSWALFTLPGQNDINGLTDTSRIDASVSWTLRLEWVFYALVPFLGWFAGRFWRSALFVGLVLVGLQVVAMPWVRSFIPGRVNGLIVESGFHLSRTFAGGMGMAALLPWLKMRLAGVDFRAPWFSLAGVAMVLAVMLWVRPFYGFVESACLVVPFGLLVLGNDWFGSLTSRPTLFLGRISYSIYLVHGIVLYLAFLGLNRIFPVAGMSALVYGLVIVVLGAVVIAVASRWYCWFEAPFISRKS